MPASPSFPSGTRGSRWKRRRGDSNPSSYRNKQPPFKDDDNDSDKEDNDNANDLDDDADANNKSEGPEDSNPNRNPNPNPGSGFVLARETEVVVDGGVRISEFPLAVARAGNRPHSSVLALVAAERANAIGGESFGSGGRESGRVCLENVSYGQLQALSTVPADSPGLLSPLEREREREEAGEGDRDREKMTSTMPPPPRIMEGSGMVKRFGGTVHVVPMHSDWFSPSTVHRLERQVVPHFFSGKLADHTPEKYMECRNHIVAKYMDDPNKRLTIFDCRGSFHGIRDDDLGRILRFLDHWGIINYCAGTPRERESWNRSAYLNEDQNGEVHVPAATLKSIDSLIKFEKPKCHRQAADVYKTPLHKGHSTSDLDSRIREHLSENHCNHCSRPLLVVYYRSLKEADVFLCNGCFHEGRFVVGHSSIDFARFDSMKTCDDIDGESWTDQETLLLLEGMELYPESWTEIAEHVGTKSKAQCILHFLRLSIEDGLLENVEVPGISPSSTVTNGNDQPSTLFNSDGNVEGTHLQDIETASRLPFANSGNPVMSLVSFLASAVAPRVAAAAAHAALGMLCAEDNLNHSGNNIPLQFYWMSPGAMEDSIQHKGLGDRSNNNVSIIPAEKVVAAAKAGLVAAAMKAKLFADHEEREIQRLSANIINNQLKRLELKLKQFAEIETLLMKECEQVEKTRQRFTAEQVRLTSSRFGTAGVTSESASSSSGVNNIGNNRQAAASSSSQPNASGYAAANQPSYTNVPFMQRQQTFPLGPRLPLSAINLSATVTASPTPSSGAKF